MSAAVSDQARSTFRATLKAMDAGELYVPCPRCQGGRQLYAQFSDGFDEYVPCPCCSGTAEADAKKAEAFIRRWVEHQGEFEVT